MKYTGKRALVCGMAKSGIAAAALLQKLGAVVTLQDMKERDAVPAAALELGTTGRAGSRKYSGRRHIPPRRPAQYSSRNHSCSTHVLIAAPAGIAGSP